MPFMDPPAASQTMQPRDQPAFPSRDPFWQSTPRSSPGLTSLMTAVHESATPPPAAMAPRARPQTMHFRRPQCATVITGIRRGDYSFEQVDTLIEQKRHLLATIRRTERGSADSTPQMHQRPRRNSGLADIIASVGTSAAPTTFTSATNAAPRASTQIPRRTPTLTRSQEYRQNCNFQVCHACRPFFRDRQYTSFEKVLSGCAPALTEEDIARLPMLNPQIARDLGLRSPHALPSPMARSGSVDITIQRDWYDDDDHSDMTPISVTTSELEMDESRVDDDDPWPCPGAGYCPLWAPEAGCAYDSGFDDGLRALNHAFGYEPDTSRMTPENSRSQLRRVQSALQDTPGGTSTASSVSLPTPSTAPLAPLTPTDESFDEALSKRLAKSSKAVSMLEILPSAARQANERRALVLRESDSTNSMGSEMEVQGGVALTEEAVGTGHPDIITNAERDLQGDQNHERLHEEQ
ncbi:hypothetical protein KC316_g2746 [Hortaea werneckii]|nr:hypothetical protein KC324_g2661 [Hortaea werneckii]KAI7591640.1 hypothetical protein KC316_g2746 [Hortaea werneckii]